MEKRSFYFEIRLSIYLLEDPVPRYEIRMPTMRLQNLFAGGLLWLIEARVMDTTLGKCTGVLTRRPPCQADNFTCLPQWHLDFPRSASPLEKLSLIQATIVID